jgi:hypothetical protein
LFGVSFSSPETTNMLKANLRHADEAIRDERRAIVEEKKMMEALERKGHPTKIAMRTLRIMERTLDTFRHHRRILLARLGLYSSRD